MRYFCRVAFAGTRFYGWQVQSGVPTIQQALATAAQIFFRKKVAFTGAGRTDAGVHAEAMGAHFDVDEAFDIGAFTKAMNALLPQDIAIYAVQPIDPDFHARFSAVTRSYQYTMCLRKSPLVMHRAWLLKYSVDWAKLRIQIPVLLGRHDFSTFCASGSGTKHAICTVHNAVIEKQGECMVFSITANRFVYNMVRSITGTLVDIGRGKQSRTLEEILYSRKRVFAGTTAPARGLVLTGVSYRGVD